MPRPLKILAVDDTLSNIIPLRAIAQKLGHNVIVAHDGFQAIDQYKSEQPDLVFMDIMMPNMDGLTAVQHIRRLPRDKWVPIVFFSAMDSVEDVVRGLESGGDDYLVKPANLELIKAKINSYARILALQDKNLEYGRELEVWRHEAEHQAELGHHVISRLVDAHGLRDPWLRWLNIPAQTFSGDLLCAARAPGDVLYVMLADATGHGLAAALSSLPLTQIFYGMTAKGFPLRAIAEELNRNIRALMPAQLRGRLPGLHRRAQPDHRDLERRQSQRPAGRIRWRHPHALALAASTPGHTQRHAVLGRDRNHRLSGANRPGTLHRRGDRGGIPGWPAVWGSDPGAPPGQRGARTTIRRTVNWA